MIRLLNDKNELSELPVDAYITRIMSTHDAYGGGHDFLRFYVQTDDSERITAAMSVFGDTVTLSASDSANLDELIGFLRACGAHRIETLLELPLKAVRIGAMYRNDANVAREEHYVNLMQAYKIMCEAFKISFDDASYADINHRFRHGSLVAATYEDAAAAFAHITDGSALLFGIGSLKRGCGSAVVQKIIKCIGAGAKFVLCDEEKRPFYEKNGFIYVNRFYNYIVE